jgi:outer membrane receptor protein involved in Fe transport
MKKTLFLLLLVSQVVIAQYSVSGNITNAKNEPLIGAHIKLEALNMFTTSNKNGEFQIDDISDGSYTLVITYLGARTHQERITINGSNVLVSIKMEDDPLNLENIILTGTKSTIKQQESGLSLTTLNADDLKSQFPLGTADLLQSIPGLITDASAGEVFTKVYSRGISASSEDDIGWYYVSLQEDGLPVSLIQHSYYSPDLFHRLDITTNKVEILNGGSASIHTLNAPGGIYNFISNGARNSFGGEVQLSSGLQGESNEIVKLEGLFSGPLGNDWFFNIGGHYRYDKGARTTNFTFSEGGQVKYNVIKNHKTGYIKLYGKILNDYTNRYNGVAATNWNDPQAAFGQDFNNTSLLMPEFNAKVPDGRYLSLGKTNGFNPANGVRAKDFAIGIAINQDLGNDWFLKFNGKFSTKEADWQTSISNVFVSLNDPLAYFISGADFPVGQLVFRDARTGSEVARVDNSGMFTGQPFQYLSNGSLPNDALLGTAAWYKFIDADEWMEDVTFTKKWSNHDLSLGAALGISSSSLFTQGSFGYATYEPNPKMLQVTLENPGQPIIALSDEHGLSNYGGLFFINADVNVRQYALYINDVWKINEMLTADAGLRYEFIKHKGVKDRYAPIQQSGGVDGNDTTAYDNSVLTPTGEKDSFNYDYNYLSASLGLNYAINNQTSLFTRFSRGNKAPELEYYLNNFTNVPINKKGEVQKISQLEFGAKYNEKQFTLAATAFASWLKDIGISNFEFDPDDNSVFYTPVQFNSTRTIGLEWQSVYSPITDLSFHFNGTIQDAKAIEWTVYDAAGTTDTGDDNILDFSNSKLPFTPSFLSSLSVNYDFNKLSSYFKWQYFAEREGNIANALQLPSYSLFSLGLNYKFSSQLSASFLISNLFNSAGLTNFFGSNSFGANADGVTKEFIDANPDASFVVVPVLPRRSMLTLSYKF